MAYIVTSGPSASISTESNKTVVTPADNREPEVVYSENDKVLVVDCGITSTISHDIVETYIISPALQGLPGPQGPKGEDGIAEEDMVYSKRVDFIDDSTLYKGEAAVGQSENSSVWRIRRLTIAEDGDVTELWANGTANFIHVWADRATYSYS